MRITLLRKTIVDQTRRGAVLPFVALCSVALIGMVALAVDIGMVAVARNQCQNAADAAAMAGARTITGDSTNNYSFSTIPTNAIAAAMANKVLGQNVTANLSAISANGNGYTFTSGNVTVNVGTYAYIYNDSNPSTEGFAVAIPRTDTTEPYSAVQTIITNTANYGFGRVFGTSTFNAKATATAVHRPRDVMIIMDLSGSMRFQSLRGTPQNNSGVPTPSSTSDVRSMSLDPDPVFPKFGHYSDTSGAALQGDGKSYASSSSEYVDPSNQTYTTNAGPPVVLDFYSNGVGVAPSSGNVAFTAASSGYDTTPGGDNFLKTSLNTGSNYAHTIKEFNNSSSTTIPKFEVNGYANYNSPFNGYTQGPNYWGKTFWVWPPCPGFTTPANWSAPSSLTSTTYKWCTWNDSYPRDWRQRFFVAVNTSNNNTPGVIQHNKILWNTSAPYKKTPGTTTSVTENGSSVNYTFRINYAAILYWLAKQDPKPFPTTMQAGRIRYYTTMPDGTDNSLNNRWWTTANSSLPNDERFWKEYIDFVLGYTATGAGTYTNTQNGAPISGLIGNGDYYTWSGSTIQVGQRADRPTSSYVNLSVNPTSPYMSGTTGPHQTSLTGPFKTSTTSAAASSGATTVSVNSLGSAPAITNYVTFGTPADLTRVYQVASGTTATSVKVSPALSAAVASGKGVQVYTTNNSVGKMGVSVNTLSSAPTVNSDYATFNNNTANVYQITTGSTTTSLNLGTGLVAAVNLQNDSVQVYASNGAVGATMMSVTGLSTAPVVNSDYVIFGGDTSNPYLITGATSMSNGYILTVSPALAASVNINGATVQIYSPYMDYADDVMRPRHQFWFGPMSFVDWLGNYNLSTGYNGNPHHWWPGNCHEAHAWACKVGVSAAIDDIKNNHPSDFVGLTFFSDPMTSRTDTGHHNRAVVPLGRNYQQLKDSLWFPPTTVTGGVSEIGPYDTDMFQVPRSDGGTAPGMGFMISYNQFSSSTTSLRFYAQPKTTYRGNAGGLGRKGANRLVIFETDGAPNTRAYSSLTSSGSDSYYPIRVYDPVNLASTNNVEWPSGGSYSNTDVYNVVKQICALTTASPPGYGTTRKPALVYSIGYGTVYDPSFANSLQTTALTFLQTVQYYGNTATDMDPTHFPTSQRIYGTPSNRITNMQAAFTSIMQSGVQVSLID